MYKITLLKKVIFSSSLAYVVNYVVIDNASFFLEKKINNIWVFFRSPC